MFCEKCKTQLDTAVKFCKNCGEKVQPDIEKSNKDHQTYIKESIKKPTWKKWWFWIVGIIIIFILIGVFTDDNSSQTTGRRPATTLQEAKDSAIGVEYEELFRNNEKYIGEIIYYQGKVVQVTEGWSDNYVLRINVTKGEYGFWENDIYVNYKGKRVLEDDIVDLWGIVKGVKTYRTVLGASRSIPEIDALYLEIADSPTAQIISPEPQPQPQPQTQTQQQDQLTPTTQQTKPAPAGIGSRTNPVPVGSTVRIGDWDFKALSSIPNAMQVVLAENMFNDPPKTGHQFFMAKIEATYTGSTSDELSWSFKFGAVGEAALAYESSCGVIPDNLRLTGEVFSGGTVSGNVCWEIRADDVSSLVMFIDSWFSFDATERVFMSLPK